MPRRPRMYLPGYTYHIVQRGNNRKYCFFEEANYALYLNLLKEVLPRYDNQLHAYCLMTNHIHLLISPGNKDSISNLLRVVGSRFAQYINKRYDRTGTLWEGRHKASAVDTDSYLLKCYRYIELNPVTAKMVQHPSEYRWSSYRCNALGDWNPIITPHQCYQALGSNELQRQQHYETLFASRLSVEDIHAIRQAAGCCLPVGSDNFKNEIGERLGRPIGNVSRGRPSK